MSEQANSSTSSTTNQHPYNPPSSILIVGAGVFGLSAALAILSSPLYSRTQLTLVDPDIPDTEALSHDQEARYTPSAHTASIDSSRIIRPDYANPAYSRLAAGAQKEWRKGYGGEGVYHESGLVVVSGQTGNEYVEAACRNVEEETDLSTDGQTEERLDVERLKGPEEIRAVSGLPPTSSSSSGGTETEYLGQAGYINRSSGWANAEGAMKTMMQRIFSHRPHINLRRGKAARLLVSHTSQKSKAFVSGIQLTEGSQLNAGLTILATGAWTPSLLDLTGRIQPTAQCLAYLPLTTTEAAALAKMPVLLNLSTGYFVIPPAENASSPSSTQSPSQPTSTSSPDEHYTHHLKVACHAHGYLTPTPAPCPMPPPALTGLRTFLSSLFPPSSPLATRPFSSSRLCHYTDTPTGDFLITYHPKLENLFLCTGGSGHGFKFLPVLGREVLSILEGRGGMWEAIWGWKDKKEEGEWRGDGSRGGERGLRLDEALQKGERSKL